MKLHILPHLKHYLGIALTAISMFCLNANTYAQGTAADNCGNATFVCSLEGYSGDTKSGYTVDKPGDINNAHCGTIENNSWLKFIPTGNSITLNLTVSNCTSGSTMQIGIYNTSNCANISNANEVNCYSPMNSGSYTYSPLVPGNTYIVHIDGYAGALCDYEIEFVGAGQTINPDIDSQYGGNYTFCDAAGTPIQLNGNLLFPGDPFSWSTNGDGTFSSTTAQNPTYTPGPNDIANGTVTVTLYQAASAACTTPVSEDVVLNFTVLEVTIPQPAPICLGESISLNSSSNPGVAYNTSQTYTNSTSTPITYGGINNSWNGTVQNGIIRSYQTIPVNCFNPNTTTLSSVCINISHTWDSDLDIFIVNPCGNRLQLFNNRGGGSDNIATACFSNTGTAIASGNAPFNGAFTPEGGAAAWNAFVAGCTQLDGTWELRVNDASSLDDGTINSWTLNFANTNNIVWTQSSAQAGLNNTDGASTTATPTTVGNHTYTVTYYDCASSCEVSEDVTVTVRPRPNIPTVTPTPPEVCKGFPITLTASSNLSSTFQWYDAATGGSLLATTASYTTPALNATTTFYVIATSADGCANTARTPVTVTVIVNNVLPQPVATTICSGQQATFEIGLTSSGAGRFYWYTSETSTTSIHDQPSSNNAQYTTATLTATTTYWVEYADKDGCRSNRVSVTATVLPIPTMQDPTDLVACAGDAFPAVSFVGTNISGYTWTNSNTSIGLAASGTSPASGTSINSFNGLNSGTTNQVATVTVTPIVNNPDGGTCPGPTQTFTYTVKYRPATPNINPGSAEICAGETTTLTATSTTPNVTYAWYDAATGGNQVANTATFTTPPLNTTTTYYSEAITSVGGCSSSSRRPVVVTVNPIPAITPGPNKAVCSGSTMNLTASAATNGSFKWYTQATGGTPVETDNGANNSSYTTPTITTATTYYVEFTDAKGCTSTREAINISVIGLPTVTKPADMSYCPDVLTTAVAFNGGGGVTSYAWTNDNVNTGLANPSGIGNVPSFTTQNAGITALVSNFTVRPRKVNADDPSGFCIGTAQTFKITVNPRPTIDGGTYPPICNGSSVQFTSVTSNANQFAWTPAASLNNAALRNPTASPTTTTTYTVTATNTGTGCTNTDDVQIVVNPLPTVTPGPNISVCRGSTGTITATAASTGTFRWYDVSAGGTALKTDPGVNNSNYLTPTINSDRIFYVAFTDANGCVSPRVAINITVIQLPTVDVISGAAYCPNVSVPQKDFSGTGADRYSWTNSNTNIGLSQAAGIGSVPTFTSINTGAANVTATITVVPEKDNPSGGVCLGTSRTYNLTIYPLPDVNGGLDRTVCQDDQITLTATGANQYVWNNGITNGVSFTPPVGTTIYTVTGTNTATGCSKQDNVEVIVNPKPIVSTGVDQNACLNSTAILTANSSTSGNFSWYDVPNGGTPLFDEAGVTLSSFTTPQITNTRTFYVAFTDANGCTSNRKPVVVTLIPSPTVATKNNITVCPDETVLEQVFTGTNVDIFRWTNNNNNTGLPSSGITSTPQFTSSNTSTIAEVSTVTVTPEKNNPSGGTCYGSPITFKITVNPRPVVNAGNDQIICEGIQTTLTATGANTYTWDNGVTNNSPFTPPVGNTVYTVIGRNSTTTCTNTDDVNVTVLPKPLVNPGPNKDACLNQPVTLSATANSQGTFSWYDVPVGGTAVFEENNVSATSYTTPNISTNKTYYVAFTDASGCVSERVAIIITVLPAPIVNNISDLTICPDVAVAAKTFSGSNADRYRWANDNTSIGLGASGVSSTPSFTSINNGTSVQVATITVTPEKDNATTSTVCYGTPKTFKITVNPRPTVLAGNDQEICEGQQTNIVATGALTYAWSNGVNNGQNFTPPLGSNNYIVTGTDTKGCTNTDAVVVVVNPAPIANKPTDIAICHNEVTPTVNLNGSADRFLWTANNTSIGIAASGTNFINSFTGTNITSLPKTAVVTITPETDKTSTTGTCQGQTVTFNITVNPLPSVNAGPDQKICEGVSTTLAGSGAVTYSWNNGVSDNQNFNPPVGSTTYTVIGTDSKGCQKSDEAIIEVTALPFANQPNNITACHNTIVQPVTFTGNAASYNWTNDNTAIGLAGAGSNATPQFTAVNNGSSIETANITVTPIANKNGGGQCAGPTVAFTISINPLPVVDAGVNQAVCQGQSIILSGTGAQSYTWDKNVQNGISFVPTLGQTIYTVTGTDAQGCMNTDQVTVNVTPQPVIQPISNVSICGAQYNTAALGISHSVPNSTFTWSSNSSSVGISNANADAPILSVLGGAYGTYTITLTEKVGSCTDSKSFTVEFIETPVSQVIAPITVCGKIATVTVNTTVSSSTIQWQSSDPNISVAPPTGKTVSITLNDNSYGQYNVISYEEEVKGCRAQTNIQITYIEIPKVDLPFSAEVCGNEFKVSTLGVARSVQSSTVNWSGPPEVAFSNNASIQPTVTLIPGNPYSNYKIRLTETNQGCSAFDEMDVIFKEKPTLQDIPDVTVCGKFASLQVNQTIPGSVIAWTKTTTDFTLTPPNGDQTDAQLQNDNYNTYQVTVTENNLGCTQAQQVLVTFNEIPTIDIPISFDKICGKVYTGITAVRTIAGSDLKWTVNSTNVGISNSNTSDPTFSLLTQDYGVYKFYIEESYLGCTSRDSMSFEFIEQPALPIILPVTTCGNIAVVKAVPSVSNSTVTWRSGAPNINVSPVIGNTTQAQLTNSQYGTYSLVTVEENNKGCSSEQPVQITFNEIPKPLLPAEDELCGAVYNAIALGASRSVSGSNIKWYGPANFAISNSTTLAPTITLTDNAYGSYDFYMIEENFGCRDTAKTTIIFKAQPTLAPIAEQIVCGKKAVFSAQPTIPGSVIRWRTTAPNINVNPAAGETTTITLIDNGYGLYDLITVEEDNSGCVAEQPIKVTFNRPPSVIADGPTIICSSDSIALQAVLGGSATTITWLTTGDGSFSSTSANQTIYRVGPGDVNNLTVTIYVETDDTDGVGPCKLARDTVTVSVSPQAKVSLIMPAVVCQDDVVPVTGQLSGAASGIIWNTNGGDGVFTDGSNPVNTYIPGPADIANGTVQIIAIAADPDGPGPCKTVSDSKLLTINKKPGITVTAPAIVCEGNGIAPMANLLGSASSVKWASSGDGTFSNDQSLSPIYTVGLNDVSLGTVSLTASTNDPDGPNGPCNAVAKSVNVIINRAPKITLQLVPTICEDDVPLLRASIGGSATGIIWETAGDGTFANPTNLTPTYTPGVSDITNESVLLTASTNDPDGAVGPCKIATANVTVTINRKAEITVTGPAAVCEGSNIQPKAILSGAANALQWATTGDGTFNNTSSSSPVYTVGPQDINTGVVTLTASTTDPDGPSGPCLADEASITVTINHTATLTLNPLPDACEGDAIRMNAVLGGTGNQVTWSTNGDGTFDNPSLLKPYYTPGTGDVNAGNVSLVAVTNDPDGTGPCLAISKTVNLKVNTAPVLVLTVPGVVCESGVIPLKATVQGSASQVTWSSTGDGTFDDVNTLTTQYVPGANDIAAGYVDFNIISNDPDGAGPCLPYTEDFTVQLSRTPEVNIFAASVVCDGASVPLQATVSGAANRVTWTTAGDGIFNDSSSTVPTYTPGTQDNNIGKVTITVETDDPDGPNGPCTTATKTVTIKLNAPLNASSTADSTQCFGSATGKITATVLGGTQPIEYSIDGGNTYQTAKVFSNLTAGLYSITVKDAVGCDTTIFAEVFDRSEIIIENISIGDIACKGEATGTVNFTAKGGTKPYSYSLNGVNYKSTAAFTGLTAGTYTAYVRDKFGCISTEEFVVNEPAENVTATKLNVIDIKCFAETNGIIDAEATGGIPPYTYTLNNFAPQPTGYFEMLSARSYTLLIEDASGCSISYNLTINQPKSPATISLNERTNVLCYGEATGEIDVLASGGTGSFTFSLDRQAFVASNIFSNLLAGQHEIVGKDQNGCTDTLLVDIVEPLAPLTIQLLDQTNVNCKGDASGSISVQAVDGTKGTGYTYSINGAPAVASGVFSNLVAGSYTIVATDGNGCTATTTVNISEPMNVLAANVVSTKNITCPGGNDGEIHLTANGGASPYAYYYNGILNADSAIKTLTAQTYNLEIRDANGCSVTMSQNLTQPGKFVFTETTHKDESCFQSNDGATALTVKGGSGLYLPFQWDDVSTQNASRNSLAPGDYTFRVTDNKGCTADTTISILPANLMTVNLSISNLKCFDDGTGAISTNVFGGAPSYTYEWLSTKLPAIMTTPDLTNLDAGNFQLTVTDQNGCQEIVTATVTQPAQLEVVLDSANSKLSACAGATEGYIAVQGVGGTPKLAADGTPIYFYQWNTSEFSSTIGPKGPGDYSVQIKDDQGCIATETFTVNFVNYPTVQHAFAAPNCGEFTANVRLVVGNANNPKVSTFVPIFPPSATGNDTLEVIPNGSSDYFLSATKEGQYTVQFKVDNQGCVTTHNVPVIFREKPIADFKYEPELPTVTNNEVQMDNLSQQATGYKWTFGDFDQSVQKNPTIKFPYTDEGVYAICLEASTEFGCYDTICRDIKVVGEVLIYVPNAFTPNADGTNDIFMPIIQGLDISDYELLIFDRWGELIFESHDPTIGWNGRGKKGDPAKSDVYIWRVEFKEKYSVERQTKVGHVSLLK